MLDFNGVHDGTCTVPAQFRSEQFLIRAQYVSGDGAAESRGVQDICENGNVYHVYSTDSLSELADVECLYSCNAE